MLLLLLLLEPMLGKQYTHQTEYFKVELTCDVHCAFETAEITVLDGDGQCCVLKMFAPHVQTCYESVQSRAIFVFQGGDGQVCELWFQ